MIPVLQLLQNFEALRDGENKPLFAEVRVNFVAPSLHVDLISERFGGIPEEERLDYVSKALTTTFGGDSDLLAQTSSRLPILITPLTIDEAAVKQGWLGRSAENSWVGWFLGKGVPRVSASNKTQRYVHFYGYKGGQARSSILALFAKMLADDGYAVLALDADVEAPSLDALFGTSADNFSQTLMGLCGWDKEINPIAGAYVGKQGNGRIDLMPCRPRNEISDLDFALLVATAPLDLRIYERAARHLDSHISAMDTPYDFVLVDHRTGVSTSVLPLLNHLPGPTAIFARTDTNIGSIPSELRRVVRSIFQNSVDVPGAFVSFSLDPNRKNDAPASSPEARVREALLAELAESIEKGMPRLGEGGEPELISTEELAFSWIDWYLDRALLENALPDVEKLQIDNLNALRKLREALGLPIEKKKNDSSASPSNKTPQATTTSLSGAKDDGQFIHIPDVERLFVPGNPYSYVLGRKGTGKTRLLREIAKRDLGQAILVAADEAEFEALRSQSIEAVAWVKACDGVPSTFWWSLIRLAIEGVSSGTSLLSKISSALAASETPNQYSDPLALKSLLSNNTENRVFLIDGLETLVPASEIKAYVAALFSVMATIQNDPLLSSKLIIRAFVREDLASDSVQNIEQQMEGRALRLKWSASSILNFAVSRLPLLPWISQAYMPVCQTIAERTSEITRSGLSEQEATEMLLRVFPSRIRRNNLSTATFLRLYFSDAGGDDTNMATFYPRLYLTFLQKLDGLAKEEPNPFTAEHRLNSVLLNKAYDDASTEFISETKQELTHLLSLTFTGAASGTDDDASKVTKFIAAFDGLSTPFALDGLVTLLVGRTSFTEGSVRESLRRMKALRMFEDRPGYAGWWRVGQLYKMGLRMKYVR